MRIGVNLYLLHAAVGGIGNYVLTFLREWSQHYPEHPLVPFTFNQNALMLQRAPKAVLDHQIRIPDQSKILQHLDAFDVFFCPFGSLYPRPIPKPSVVLLMDIQERFFPEFFDEPQRRARAYHYTWSLRMADRVMAISDFARKTFIRLAGIPGEKIQRVYLCVDQFPNGQGGPVLPLEHPTPFAFYPANNWPHKNHGRLFQALIQLREQGLRIPCVLTGVQVEGASALDAVIREHGVQDQVCYLGRVSDTDMGWLYRHARLVVNPSLFEGFGLPVVEAMGFGVPLACSGTSSLPEIGHDAAVYFDPENTDDMARTIRRAWEDEPLRDRMRAAAVRQGASFTPEATMRDTLAVFKEAVEAYTPARYKRQRIFWSHVSRFWNPGTGGNGALRARAHGILRDELQTVLARQAAMAQTTAFT